VILYIFPPELEAFHIAIAAEERRRVFIVLCFALVLVPAAVVLDVLVYPDKLYELQAVRWGITALLVAALIRFRRCHTYEEVTTVSFMVAMVTGLGSVALTYITGLATSSYYEGLCMVLFGASVFLVWPLRLAFVFYASMILAYALPPIVLTPELAKSASFAYKLYFIVGYSAMGIGALRARELAAIRQYETQRAVEEKNRALKDADDLKTQMFQNISHELRTPLTLILAPADLLLERPEQVPETPSQVPETGLPLHREDRQHLATIRQNAYRLLHQINDILDLARLDAGASTPELRPIDIRDLVDSLLAEARPASLQRGITLVTDIDPAVGIYWLDPQYLEKILLNLVSNALKFCRPGDRVIVAARDDGNGLELSVDDDGPGIPRALTEQVFERFRQVQGGTTRRHGGTGLGLSLVRQLTEALGGTVSLESDVGRGARFVLRFDRALAAGEADAPEAASHTEALFRRSAFHALFTPVLAPDPSQAASRGPRVLVAEDEPELAETVRQTLASFCRVEVVGDGLLARDRALAAPPHLIVTDVMMPGMDGVELTATLREHLSLRDTPILMLSARSAVEDRITGRQAGADAFLPKPFHVGELRAAVEGLLRSRMRIVGEFLIQDRIGGGAQAEIFRAQHLTTGTPAALKILTTPAHGGTDGSVGVEKEVAALAQLEHPNVVRIFAHGTAQGRNYFAMELLEGVVLSSTLEGEGPLAPEVVVGVGIGLARALQAIHEAGIVHRDIKTSNVMLVSGRDVAARVRLIDFGVMAGGNMPEIERAGRPKVVGTPAYLAPEILEGQAHTPSSDLYALGVLLYKLATAENPYRADELMRLVHAILTREVPSVRTQRPDFPQTLDEVIQRLLTKEPIGRYPNARALEEALLATGIGKVGLEPILAHTL
jgi:signal transduction histidine kinase/CheY-like chemotaxis protein